MLFCNSIPIDIIHCFCFLYLITVLSKFAVSVLFIFFYLFIILNSVFRYIIFLLYHFYFYINIPSSPSSIIFFVLFPIFCIPILLVFIALNGRIYFCWNQTGQNFLRWSNWILIFQLQTGMWFWLMHIAVLCNQITTIRKWWLKINILLFSDKWKYQNMFYVGNFYSNMNAILKIHFPHILIIIGKNVSRSSIMTILLTFIKSCRLIIWYMLWSTIIIAGTGCFTRIPIPFCIIFNIEVWLKLSKYSQKNNK